MVRNLTVLLCKNVKFKWVVNLLRGCDVTESEGKQFIGIKIMVFL